MENEGIIEILRISVPKKTFFKHDRKKRYGAIDMYYYSIADDFFQTQLEGRV